jgi:hypothetical protein
MNLRDHRSFILTGFAMASTILLAFVRPGTETAVLTTLPVLLASYVGARSAEKIMTVRAASQDPNCDTSAIVDKINK